MAPRRRPVKKGERRMDAALDAMTPYGFPNKLVRQTVAQLLKVYGGNEGWVFIEDSAYTLLIDTLLEQQQQTLSLPQPQQSFGSSWHKILGIFRFDCLIEDNPGNGPNVASPAGCSNIALLPCSNPEAYDDAPSTNRAIDTISAASETGNQVPIMAVDTASATSETGDELPIKPIDTTSATSELCNQPSIKAVDIVSATGENDNQVPIKAIDAVLADNESESPLTKRSSQPIMGRVCHKRRKPCHGWISSDDDDDEEELIELPPAPLSNALYKLVNGGVN